jgi:acyl-CoA thioester hydrolase
VNQPVPIRVPVDIRWRDLDALGHVNNAVYISYFEHARMAYVRALTGDQAPMVDERTPLPRDFQFILAEVTCHFRAPATLAERLIAEIYVSRGGRKSFVFEYRIGGEKSQRLFAEGCSTQVWYDYASGQSQAIPDEVIGQMEALQGVPIPRS